MTFITQIPFGPLAYFPGQLVHTNDITAPEDGPAQPPGQGGSNVKAEQSQPSRLRSAKQARLQAERMRTGARSPVLNMRNVGSRLTGTVARTRADLEARVAALENEIATKEEELRQKRLNERKKGKGKAADLVGGDMGEEDWTINERGEVSCRRNFIRCDLMTERGRLIDVVIVAMDRSSTKKACRCLTFGRTCRPNLSRRPRQRQQTPQKQAQAKPRNGAS